MVKTRSESPEAEAWWRAVEGKGHSILGFRLNPRNHRGMFTRMLKRWLPVVALACWVLAYVVAANRANERNEHKEHVRYLLDKYTQNAMEQN